MTKLLTIAIVLTTLAACGNTRSDRALSGAGLGAAAGAVGGALVSGSPVTGAAIGAGAGAATGAVTDKDDIDLGNPAWRE